MMNQNMLIPIRCFTCNANVRFMEYTNHVTNGIKVSEAMDKVYAKRYCCRRMLLCNPIELTDIITDTDTKDQMNDDGSQLLMTMKNVRTLTCD